MPIGSVGTDERRARQRLHDREVPGRDERTDARRGEAEPLDERAAVRGGRIQHAAAPRRRRAAGREASASARAPPAHAMPSDHAGHRRRTASAVAKTTSTIRSGQPPSTAKGRQTAANTPASTMSVVSCARVMVVGTDPPYAFTRSPKRLGTGESSAGRSRRRRDNRDRRPTWIDARSRGSRSWHPSPCCSAGVARGSVALRSAGARHRRRRQGDRRRSRRRSRPLPSKCRASDRARQ